MPIRIKKSESYYFDQSRFRTDPVESGEPATFTYHGPRNWSVSLNGTYAETSARAKGFYQTYHKTSFGQLILASAGMIHTFVD